MVSFLLVLPRRQVLTSIKNPCHKTNELLTSKKKKNITVSTIPFVEKKKHTLSSTKMTPEETSTVTRDECLHLNDILGSKTLSKCYNLKHTLSQRDDSFHTSQKIAEDDTKHRSSWLMPRVARRFTTKSNFHVSKWRPAVKVDHSECARLRALLLEKMGTLEDAEEHLPAACKKYED